MNNQLIKLLLLLLLILSFMLISLESHNTYIIKHNHLTTYNQLQATKTAEQELLHLQRQYYKLYLLKALKFHPNNN